MSVCAQSCEGKLSRIACVVRLKILVVCEECGTKILHVMENKAWLQPGGSMVRLPAERMSRDGGLDKAVEKLWTKKLGLSPEFVAQHFDRLSEKPLIYEEEEVSGS